MTTFHGPMRFIQKTAVKKGSTGILACAKKSRKFMRRQECLCYLAIALLCFFAGCSKTPEDHARVAKSGAAHEKRKMAVETLIDQTLLADVAANASRSDTRAEAARKLTDSKLLADVARTTRDSEVASVLVEKITDPQTLAMLVREAVSDYTRVAAACALNDQTALAEFARNRKDLGVRRKAIEKLTDQGVLAEIALEKGAMDSIRMLALDKLDDQQTLAKIVMHDHNENMRTKALVRISDQHLLGEIAKVEDGAKARRAAPREFGARVDGRSELARMGREKLVERFARDATNKITDQAILADIATNAGYVDVRKSALKKITDQRLLLGIMRPVKKTDDDLSARSETIQIMHAAFRGITDQELLAEIVLNDVRYDNFHYKNAQSEIRRSAFDKVTDQKLLARIARSAPEESTRIKAAERLSDTRTLADIAGGDDDDNVVWNAVARMESDQQALATLARSGNMKARLLAVWRLDDRALLAGIAANDADEPVRNAASAKLAGKLQSAAPENIFNLIRDGKLLVQVRSGLNQGDYASAYAHLRKTVPWRLDVLIPAGICYVSQNKTVSDMIGTRDEVVALKDADGLGSCTILTAYTNMRKRIPARNETVPFALGGPSENPELMKLAVILGATGRDVSYATRQAAVWIVTDNANGHDFQNLILKTTRYDAASRGNITESSRMIFDHDAAGAMRLCATSGIDIKTKRIWRDRHAIHAGLEPGELKNWLEDCMKP